MPAGTPNNTLTNVPAAQLAAQVANWAAQLEFQKERMRLLELPENQARIRQGDQQIQLEIQRLAWEKAEAAWKHAIEESSVTGTYQGQPTVEWLERQARLTGVLNGQQTLEGALTQAQIAQMNAAMANDGRRIVLEERRFDEDTRQYGQEFAYREQQDRVKNRFQEADITGRYNGQDTLAREQMMLDAGLRREDMQGRNVQSYLQLVSSLQGNPFKMARVLGSTPGGLQDLVNAWAGQYALPGATGSGMAPGTPSFQDLFNPMGLSVPPGSPGAPSTPVAETRAVQQLMFENPGISADHARMWVAGASVDQVSQLASKWTPAAVTASLRGTPTAGVPAMPGAAGSMGRTVADWANMPGIATTNYVAAPAGEGYTYSPPGTQAPIDAYNYQPTPAGQTQVYPPGIASPPSQSQVSTVTPQTPNFARARLQPNQINAENYANTNKVGQDLMWQWFEDEEGWAPGSAQDAFAKSLPRYAGPQRGTVSAGLGM